MFKFSLFSCNVVGLASESIKDRQAGDEGDDVAADVVSDSCHGVSPELVVWRLKLVRSSGFGLVAKEVADSHHIVGGGFGVGVEEVGERDHDVAPFFSDSSCGSGFDSTSVFRGWCVALAVE
ncbi:hypothetical protein ACPWR0_23600 [Pandoraea pneumonica]|uniref:hypothetical protein n=1 Tax=Pandoraea pneumonica TaxID=2508299 RepID=UPI003CEA3A4D